MTVQHRNNVNVTGQGPSTMVFAHGFGCDQSMWRLLAPAFAKAPRLVNEERIYNATAEALFKIISEARGAHCLVVVGHNPGLHDVAVQLIESGDADARDRVAEKLPTSGLAVIDLAFDDWSRLHRHAGRLERFVTRRLIAAATD